MTRTNRTARARLTEIEHELDKRTPDEPVVFILRYGDGQDEDWPDIRLKWPEELDARDAAGKKTSA